MENHPFSAPQSIAIHNSQVSGQFGQAGKNLRQTQIDRTVSETPLEPEDAIALMARIEEIIRTSDLPAGKKQKALNYLESAKEEAQQEEPDTNFAAKSLQRSLSVVKNVAQAVAGQMLLDKMQSIIERLLPWLQVELSFFGF